MKPLAALFRDAAAGKLPLGQIEAVAKVLEAAEAPVVVTDFYLKRPNSTATESKLEFLDWHKRLDDALTALRKALE